MTLSLKHGVTVVLLLISASSFGATNPDQVMRPSDVASASGQLLYTRHCAACHGSGQDKPGTVALATKYNGNLPGELVQRTDLHPLFIATIVRTGIASMPPFRKTEISDQQLELLSQWLAQRGRITNSKGSPPP